MPSTCPIQPEKGADCRALCTGLHEDAAHTADDSPGHQGILVWGILNLSARAWRACAAPAMRSSVVTMPGDRLWMPTLLMFRSFNSACRPTVTAQPATPAAPMRLCAVNRGIRMGLLKLESATEDLKEYLQRLAELGKAALGGAVCCKPRCGAPVGARAIHVENVATRSLLPHDSDCLQPAISLLLTLHADTSHHQGTQAPVLGCGRIV